MCAAEEGGDAMTELERRITTFADAKLRRDIPGRMKKLGEEFGELAEAILSGDRRNAIIEAADMGNVLTDLVHLLSQGGTSLSEAMAAKIAICEQRTYVNGSRLREESQ